MSEHYITQLALINDFSMLFHLNLHEKRAAGSVVVLFVFCNKVGMIY